MIDHVLVPDPVQFRRGHPRLAGLAHLGQRLCRNPRSDTDPLNHLRGVDVRVAVRGRLRLAHVFGAGDIRRHLQLWADDAWSEVSNGGCCGSSHIFILAMAPRQNLPARAHPSGWERCPTRWGRASRFNDSNPTGH